MSVVRRGDVLDWYVDGFESAVLVDDKVIVLSELATAVFEALGADGLSLAEVAEALEEVFGPPPEGSLLAATRAVVDALVEAQVLLSTD